ncbi:phage terminase large subunit [Sporobacter termitidis DSM 10068]|uniref:Phage terminase large subunit n=1 Tax=Sporobacter termitidis DSM 10068 TaxID=1123282 RepID=A0A1M5YHQ5_9FIRM|nr:phage terminase large subunit [Sporobacter termitidis]SHI11418.1 phage terminase large subunit [Sporobacter termitidis DSM 10068]
MAIQRQVKTRGAADVSIKLGCLTPKQEQFCRSRTLYTAYGGARGGGKTHAVRWKAVGGALRYDGIRILILRRTYPELQANHIEQICKMVPSAAGTYSSTLHAMYFKNGSVIKFGHYSGDASETEYQGQEYDWIFMDEATQFTEREFRFIGSLLRGVNDFPKRFYLTCNPGGVGHRWVKRLFIDRAFITDRPNPEENENPADYSFIPATVEDNVYLMESSPAYVRMLSGLPDNIRRAHRYGDWNALAGTYFPEFRAARHVVEPFQVPGHWLRYRAFDYGLDMLACGWFAQDESGRSFMYRELKAPNLIVSEAAKLIRSRTLPEESIAVTFAPPDMWSRQKDSGKTMAELFMLSGVPIVRADNSRVQGWLQVKEALAPRADGGPSLLFFKNCTETTGAMEAILTDEKNPNDCATEPHDITHLPDAVRYYCVSRTLKTEREAPGAARIPLEDDDAGENYDAFMTGGAAGRGYLEY